MNTKRIIREFVEDKNSLYDELVSLSPEKREEVRNALTTIVDNKDDDRPDNWRQLPGYNPDYFYDDEFRKMRDGGEEEEEEEGEELNEISYGGIPELKAEGFFSNKCKC